MSWRSVGCFRTLPPFNRILPLTSVRFNDGLLVLNHSLSCHTWHPLRVRDLQLVWRGKLGEKKKKKREKDGEKREAIFAGSRHGFTCCTSSFPIWRVAQPYEEGALPKWPTLTTHFENCTCAYRYLTFCLSCSACTCQRVEVGADWLFLIFVTREIKFSWHSTFPGCNPCAMLMPLQTWNNLSSVTRD